MRISLVTETFAPEINGVAMTLGRLAEGLRSLGHEIEVVCPSPSNRSIHQSDSSGPSLWRVPGLPIPGYAGLRFGLPVWRRLRRHWVEQRPDVVYVATEGPLGAVAVLNARSLGVAVCSGFHTRFDHYCRQYRLAWLERPVRAYLRALHNRTAMTLVPTAQLAGELAARGFRDLRVLSRGVDTELFHPARRDDSLREQWRVGKDGLAVLYVGRLAAEKNLPLALLAFESLRQHRPDARLILVGDGPLAATLRQSHRSHHFAGIRRGDDLARHYASADLFLFPSLSETYGNVTQEAMASGLAVVAFAEAAAAELIRDGENGALVSSGDAAEFLAAAQRLAGDAALRRRLASNARASVVRRDWAEIARGFEALLSEAAQPAVAVVREV